MLTLRTSIGQLRVIYWVALKDIAWCLRMLRFCMVMLSEKPFQKQAATYADF
jgi:uncharacterized membrane protein